jgi:hypothetical protein
VLHAEVHRSRLADVLRESECVGSGRTGLCCRIVGRPVVHHEHPACQFRLEARTNDGSYTFTFVVGGDDDGNRRHYAPGYRHTRVDVWNFRSITFSAVRITALRRFSSSAAAGSILLYSAFRRALIASILSGGAVPCLAFE